MTFIDKNQINELTSRLDISDDKLNHKDTYFYRFNRRISTHLIKEKFLTGNSISIFIKTTNFQNLKYFIKDVKIFYLKEKIKKSLKSKKITSGKSLSKKIGFGLKKNLLNFIYSFFDFKQQLIVANVSRRFKNAYGEVSKIIYSKNIEMHFKAKSDIFSWCNEKYFTVDVSSEIDSCKVRSFSIELASFDQGNGLIEDLSWI